MDFVPILVFVLSLTIFIVVILFALFWAFNRENGPSIICWSCQDEFDEAATNCPVCGVTKNKPFRCVCGHLHSAGQKPCDGEVKGRMR